MHIIIGKDQGAGRGKGAEGVEAGREKNDDSRINDDTGQGEIMTKGEGIGKDPGRRRWRHKPTSRLLWWCSEELKMLNLNRLFHQSLE